MQTLLVADDDRETQHQLSAVLLDFHVEAVVRGWEVLQKLADGEVDVIVSEVHLEDMPGWLLLPQIHQLAPHTPVIAIAADDSWETSRRMRIENAPLFYYALKPLDLREMAKAVRSAARWHQRLKQETA